MKLTIALLALWLSAFAVSAQEPAAPIVLTPIERLALDADADAERLFRAAAEKLPEAAHLKKVRAVTDAILKSRGLTLDQARAALRGGTQE